MPFLSHIRQRRRVLLLLVGLALILVTVHLCSLVGWGTSVFSSRSRDVQNLARTLPTIQRYHLEAFRNQDWCRNIAYTHGQFSDSTHPTTCNLFEGPAQAFDPQASADFQAVRHTFAASGVRIIFVNSTFDERMQLQSAEFNLDCLLCQRTRYVYAPHHSPLPDDMPSEMWFTPITDDWYMVEEDWN